MKTGMGRPGAIAAAGLLAITGFGAFAGAALAQDDHYVGASLFGENERGHEGAGKDAGGDFSAYLDMKAGKLCYYLEVYGLGDVTAVHLSKGDKDKNGESVVELTVSPDDEVCVDMDMAVLRAIQKDEGGYYVNVHTKAFPEGAIRGQLGT